MRAIILAGGEGRRLQPYTFVLPKPLVPLGQKPVLDHLLGWLHRGGVREATLAVGYLAPAIEAYFAVAKPRVKVDFLCEPRPLSTAGPLKLMEKRLRSTFLVVNGDTYTDLDLRAMLAFHRKRRAIATVATCEKRVPITLGVLDADATGRVTTFTEKPTLRYRAAMGVNIFEPEVLKFIPRGRAFGFDQLVMAMMGRGLYAYRHEGFWFDIGRPEDYQAAVAHLERQ